MHDERRLDGNAAGGLLAEVFPFEMTVARCTCARCGKVEQIGALLLYGGAMGAVLRCPTCDHALIRIARIRGQYWLDLQGVRALRLGGQGIAGAAQPA